MPAHKRKSNYNAATTMQELLTAVCDYYGDPVDDRKEPRYFYEILPCLRCR